MSIYSSLSYKTNIYISTKIKCMLLVQISSFPLCCAEIDAVAQQRQRDVYVCISYMGVFFPAILSHISNMFEMHNKMHVHKRSNCNYMNMKT